MNRKVVITGTGVVSPLGDSRGAVHEALCAGTVAMKTIKGFDAPGIAPAIAGEISDFDPKPYIGSRNLRSLNRISQLLCVATKLAIDDSGWTVEALREDCVGLVAGTMFCSAHTISEFDVRAIREGPSRASPIDFANTVINAAAGQAAIWHKLSGPNSTISAGSTSGLQAIAYAVDLIRNGHVDAVLAGGVEELTYEPFFGFFKSGVLCNSPGKNEPLPIPFDNRRNGFFLSEGAALLMLEDADSATARGATTLAEIKGHGSSFDYQSTSKANGNSPFYARTITGAISQALSDAKLTMEEIQLVSASANGGPTDTPEAEAIADIADKQTEHLAVIAPKGILGEGLGAAGALQSVEMIESLHDGRAPGVVGLRDPISTRPGSIDSKTRNVTMRNGLINAVGLDGNCCALIIGKGG